MKDLIDRQEIIDIYNSCSDMLSDEELQGAEIVMGWINDCERCLDCQDCIHYDECDMASDKHDDE